MKSEMYLPESPFFKNSLAGASGLVLMSVPDVDQAVSLPIRDLIVFNLVADDLFIYHT